eukprot:7318854-Prymnesium_polylepis.3
MSDVVARQQVVAAAALTVVGQQASAVALEGGEAPATSGEKRKQASKRGRKKKNLMEVCCPEKYVAQGGSCAAAAVGGAGWPARWKGVKGAVRQRVSLLVQGNSELPFTAEGAAALLAAAAARAAVGDRALLRAVPQVEGWVELLKRVDDGSSAFAKRVSRDRDETKSIGYSRDRDETKSISYSRDQGERSRSVTVYGFSRDRDETKSIGYSRDRDETKSIGRTVQTRVKRNRSVTVEIGTKQFRSVTVEIRVKRKCMLVGSWNHDGTNAPQGVVHENKWLDDGKTIRALGAPMGNKYSIEDWYASR